MTMGIKTKPRGMPFVTGFQEDYVVINSKINVTMVMLEYYFRWHCIEQFKGFNFFCIMYYRNYGA